MNSKFISVKNLSKSFYPPLSYKNILKLDLKAKNPIKALCDISFSLKQKEILGILGPNGAGKTTLLKILSGLITADKGKINIKGFDPATDDSKIKSLVGLVSCDDRNFYWRLSPRQNLKFFASLYNLSAKAAEQRIDDLLEIFKIKDHTRPFSSYSTGIKRKFALIKALLHDPQILIFDEPMKSLDFNSKVELASFIAKQSKQGKTIIIATHNIREAESICNRFLIISKGTIKGLGKLEQLRQLHNIGSGSLDQIYLNLINND